MIIKWDGSCQDNHAHGQGNISYLIGNNEVAHYKGLVQNGYPNGEGQFILRDGYTMQGNFVKGVLNGEGQIVFADTAYKTYR
ncbi:MAG: hypothetical protein KL787_04895 [Taibaiella sp.]|nr:hypothetical protein [Taibaiella sp.]